MLNIFTLNWNGEDKLKKLVPTLLNSVKDFNWFIKDNASKDDSISYLNSLENKNIKVLPYKNNTQNFSAGMNYCFNEASPNDEDLVLLLNNDVIFNDDTSIQNMINIMDKDPKVGAVGARLLYTGTNNLQHAGVVFHDEIKTPTHFRVGEKSDSNAEKNRLFQVVTGAVLLTRAKYFKNACKNKSGNLGMDEDYHWAFDDVDLCLCIKYNMEKKIVYCGNTNVFHEESASLKKNPANKLFMTHNVNHLKNKWKDRYILDMNKYTKDSKFNLYQ